MKDRQFLIWIHERLEHIHNENPCYDYMHKLRALIKTTPKRKETPNLATYNNLADLITDLNKPKRKVTTTNLDK